jgi:NTP pyrophosphatase (non-canonical NTP hydrolase)
MKTANILKNGNVIVNGIQEPKQNIFFRLSLITCEISDVVRDIEINNKNIKLSFADAFIQLSILCKELKIDEEKIKVKRKDSIIPKSINIFVLLGKVHRSIVYTMRFPNEKVCLDNTEFHIANLNRRLSELCEEQELNENEVRELGWEHLREKYKEFKERGWKNLK